MNRRRIVILIGVLAVIVVFVAAPIALLGLYSRSSNSKEAGAVAVGHSPSPIPNSVSGNAFSSNGNLKNENSAASAQNEATIGPSPSSAVAVTPSGTTPPAAAGTSRAAVSSGAANSLPIPVVADSEIASSSAGMSGMLEFLEYFSVHSKDISFDNKKFDAVLKDKNGVVLFAPALIDKAIADNDFGEIKDSLIVQKDFTNAEIGYIESIKVTGDAAALAKETIGTEELTLELIDKALGVSSGAVPKSDFSKFYNQFNATIAGANSELVAKVGKTSLLRDKSWLLGFEKELGVEEARAAAPVPFGGSVVQVLPCAPGGMWVAVSPPVPATLVLTAAVMASPLFFPYRAIHPGAWWLGLESLTPMACLQIPPLIGEPVILAGTSV